MRRLLSRAAMAVAVFSTSSQGQVAVAPVINQYDQELLRIGAVRQQKTTELDAEEAACFDQFAVNDCQNKVAVKRRQLLAELKRQESAVKDAQRQIKATDQLERSADKAAQHARKAADLQSGDQQSASPENRQRAQDDKVNSHRQQAKKVEPRASTPKLASGLDAQTQAENRAVYQEKQQAAEKRRRDREQRLIDHGTGSPPLPVAP